MRWYMKWYMPKHRRTAISVFAMRAETWAYTSCVYTTEAYNIKEKSEHHYLEWLRLGQVYNRKSRYARKAVMRMLGLEY